MNALAVVRCSCAIRGGSNEWVSELHTPPDLQQPGVHRRVRRRHDQAERPRAVVEEHGVAQGIGGGGEDEKLGIGWELLETSFVSPFDFASHRLAAGKTEPACECCRFPGAQQLQQRNRVAVALRDDLVTDGRIERAVHVVE